MCVAITLLPGATLTKEEIWKMGMTNGDGVGVAWVDHDLGKVRWYKTVNYKVAHIQHVVDYHIGSPRLVHFRLSTVGGTKAELCHPFAIDERGSCAPVGIGDRVMIHNGHWHRYKDVLDIMDKEGLLPDKGPWSDTRTAAYLANQDLEWLQVIGGKVAVLDSTGQLTHIGDWDEYREGMRVSNKHWTSDREYKTGGYSGFSKWPGWDKSWDSKTHEQYEADKKAKQGATPVVVASPARSGKEKDAAHGENAEAAQKGETQEEDGGGSGGTSGYVRPGGWVGAKQEGKEEQDGHGLPHGRGRRPIDLTPWQNPATGRWYQATEVGGLVEIAPEAVHRFTGAVGRGVGLSGGAHHSYKAGATRGISGPGGDAYTGSRQLRHVKPHDVVELTGKSIHELTQEEWETIQEWDGECEAPLGGEGGHE